MQALGPNNAHLRTLNLFAFESYLEFKKNKANYIPLTDVALKKLKLISIADMANKKRESLQRKSLTPVKSTLGYQDLMKELDINDIRELEDSIIEAIFNGLLQGKLD